MNNENNKKAVTPKLTCNVTGKARVTNRKYLQAKADKKNITVEEYLDYYVCKDALRQLKAGKSPQEINPESDKTTEWAKEAVVYNGKNGPSGPHAPASAATPAEKKLSPEVEKLVAAVQEQEQEAVAS